MPQARFSNGYGTPQKAYATFPKSARPEIAADARSLTVGNYLILYRLRKSDVEIVRLLHGAQYLDNIWD
ncbi:type II toxin-antitoxin system RelE/ParE family toxin [Pseudonocardia sp. TMWB2A]|uniref:type II toxin-antitoxin system RelE/ParE family toxin n=1 Tax=Pseudonocardia sp. TMWB2A TaxID=687430 RepID=UPI003FD453B6